MAKRRGKAKSKVNKAGGEPVGLERVGTDSSSRTDQDEIAIELPVEENDLNAQTS